MAYINVVGGNIDSGKEGSIDDLLLVWVVRAVAGDKQYNFDCNVLYQTLMMIALHMTLKR